MARGGSDMRHEALGRAARGGSIPVEVTFLLIMGRSYLVRRPNEDVRPAVRMLGREHYRCIYSPIMAKAYAKQIIEYSIRVFGLRVLVGWNGSNPDGPVFGWGIE